jgi:hypothetical protein
MEKVKQTCVFCSGTGKNPHGGETETCPYCKGGGSSFDANVSLPAPLFYSYQVFDATVPGEYNALSAAEKSLYLLVISQVYVNLAEGSNSRTVLANLFGAGTTTRANLLALIGG